VIGNTWLTWRIDLTRCKFRDEHARLHSNAAAHPNQIASVQKLVHAVQHVEIHDAD